MTRALILFPEAAEEAVEAAVWYNKQQRGLGYEFLAELERSFARIRENPRQFPRWERDSGFSRAMVARFPYVVFFVDTNDLVEIVAVAHGRRTPGYWRPRLKRIWAVAGVGAVGARRS